MTTARARVRRLPQRGAYDAATIHAILDAAFVAHVGFVVEGQPFVIPTLYGRKENRLYLHGSAASRMLREAGGAIPLCVTVTLVDALVLARSAFHHSMNYRSVVAFGTARLVAGAREKLEALNVISEQVLAGRWDEVRPPTGKELKATAVLEFSIEEASAKARTGFPVDDEEDYALPVWAGILPLPVVAGEPVADPRLRPEIVMSRSVKPGRMASGRGPGIGSYHL